MIAGDLRERVASGLVAALVLAAAALGQDPAARARAEIERILAKDGGQGTVAVYARESGGAEWVSRHADAALKPASVMKLFTSAAVLERFGAGFRYRTRLFFRDGELLVVGSGDPAIGDERLSKRFGRSRFWEYDAWAQALRDAGVTQLRRIVLDDHIFDQQWRHPDWDPGQMTEWYQAPVGALNINDNCVDPRVVVRGNQVSVEILPRLPSSFIEGAVRHGEKQAPWGTRSSGQDIFRFGGTANQSTGLKSIAIGEPTIFFGHALREALRTRGIAGEPEIVRRNVPEAQLSQWRSIATVETPLVDILWRTNTHSQNLFSECLFKSLSAYRPDGSPGGVAGSWDGGRDVLIDTLRRLGVNTNGAVFRDGSGLSHDNRVSARQIVSVIDAMRGHRHAALFVDSLARPGEDGSMRTRYNDRVLIGRMWGKTGSISGVRTLAGIIEREDGRTLTMAILINGNAPGEVITRIAAALAK